ncbi:MAG: threonylcarbamoyl-AMP synthase [Ignavibacteriales bacterium]|nr:threonylcarbamoyl-AMP synthase [Ignavibacteriales bacterium]
MTTRVIKISVQDPDAQAIRIAVNVLKSGGLVCFPTETVYGLGADAFNVDAIRKVFEAKGRPSDNPLIVHVGSVRAVRMFVTEVPPKAKKLMSRFWPGPLTLVMQGKRKVPAIVRAGLETVAVRMPNHPAALALIRGLGTGIVAPSANLSGKPSPTTAEHVYADLHDRVDVILDAGATEIGIESTVLDVTAHPPAILRQGGLTKEHIEKVIGRVRTTNARGLLKRSPGTRHRHYAPKARLVIIRSAAEITFPVESGKRVGLIYHSLDPGAMRVEHSRKLSRDVNEFARSLFSAIRELDGLGVDTIFVEKVEKRGIGVAVMQRLMKSAE